MPNPTDYVPHSPYTDPGPHAALLAAVDPSPSALHAAACATVVHYRGSRDGLRDGQDRDVDLRWLRDILATAVERVPGPLSAPRPVVDQVAGCCRDHSLLTVGVLRQHGVPARTRVGFAGYFTPGFHHDHVVVERWDGQRWVRSDPELDAAHPWGFDPHDLPTGPDAPFLTAARTWQGIRAGRLDPSLFGVDPSLPDVGGTPFVRWYVLLELAHRQRDEVLLWDVWETWGEAGEHGFEPAPCPHDELDAQVDEIADLLLRADDGDAAAEAELDRRYATDARLRPDGRVLTLSPTGRLGDTDLEARTTTWR